MTLEASHIQVTNGQTFSYAKNKVDKAQMKNMSVLCFIPNSKRWSLFLHEEN